MYVTFLDSADSTVDYRHMFFLLDRNENRQRYMYNEYYDMIGISNSISHGSRLVTPNHRVSPANSSSNNSPIQVDQYEI